MAMRNISGEGSGRLRRFLPWLLPAVLVGAVPRLWGLSRQIVSGDELHAVKSTVAWSLGKILTTYRLADHCIPLTAYDELLVMAGVPLTEILLRLPAVLAGLATLVVLPSSVEPRLGRPTAVLFGWLVALSPGLIYYSRFARPYAPVVLLGFVAGVCFWRYWEEEAQGRGARWGVAYALAAAGAVWFHPGSAPYVAAPLVYGAVDLLFVSRGRAERRGFGSLVWVGGLLALLLATFLVPAHRSFLKVLSEKGGAELPDLATWATVLRLQSGTVWPWLSAAFWLIAPAGLACLVRRRPRLALFTGVQLACLLVGLFVLRPDGVHIPVVLHRYLLIGLPVALLWVACALSVAWSATLSGAGVGTRAVGRAAVGLLLLGLVATHPYVLDPAFQLGPFAGMMGGGWFVRDLPEIPPAAVPRPYRVLAGEPGDGAVVEAASPTAFWRLTPHAALWRAHGRPVVLATTEEKFAHPGLGFRTLVPATPERMAATGARFVVVMRDSIWLDRILGKVRRGTPWERAVASTPPTSPRRSSMRDARRVAASLQEAWGPPTIQGDGVLAWDLRGRSR